MRIFTLVLCANAVVLKLVCITPRNIFLGSLRDMNDGWETNHRGRMIFELWVGRIGQWCSAGLYRLCFQDRLFIFPSLHGSAGSSQYEMGADKCFVCIRLIEGSNCVMLFEADGLTNTSAQNGGIRKLNGNNCEIT
jgi:hypothetical protein